MKRMVLLTAIVALTLAFPSLAEPTRNTSWKTACNMLASGVTVREFFQAVDPAMLTRIPRKFHDVKIEPASAIRSVRQTDEYDLENIDDIDDITVNITSATNAESGSQCYFGVSSTVHWPPFFRLPYMSVIGQLYGPGGMWGYISDSGTNVWRVTENDTISVQGGESYATTGIHFCEFPPGYFPATAVGYTQTRWVHVP